MVAYLLFGMLAGIVGAALSLILGRSLLYSFLSYMTVGSATTVLVPVFMYMLDGLTDAVEPRTGRDTERDTHSKELGSNDKSGTMRILAVDDDQFIRELIPKIAAKAGYDLVHTAACAEDALRILQRSSESFGCILLDIHMPGMDGIELCRQIRRVPAYRNTPVIMLTAMSDERHLNQAFEAGATDYTTKPFDVIGLGEQLKSAEERSLPTKKRSAPVPVFRHDQKSRRIS